MLLWYSDESTSAWVQVFNVLNPTCSRPPYGKIDSNFGICVQMQTRMVFPSKWNFIGLTFAEFDEKYLSFLWFCFFIEYWEWKG